MRYKRRSFYELPIQRVSPTLILAFGVIAAVFSSPSVCQAVTLTITANNGSVTATPSKSDYNIGDIVELKPKPNTGYCFSEWTGDARGNRLIIKVTMDGDKTITANFVTWQPPIGIPAPSFGISETYRMYDDINNRNPDLTYHQNTEGGYYTHYVDNTHPNATDTDNPYGTADKPRLTLPIYQGRYPIDRNKWLQEGSVVEVHGGPYDLDPEPVPPEGVSVYSNASSDKPVFIRGIGSPVIHYNIWYLAGQYLIIEGFEFDDTLLWVRYLWNIPTLAGDYVSIRNNEFAGTGEVESYSGGVATAGATADKATNIVIYNNNIHHFGQWDWYGSGDENDAMGVNVMFHSEHIWVVDNHIHHNGGDSVHVGNVADRSTRYVYIGRNDMHDDRENAVDVKEAQDVIISQNEMYNYLILGREDEGRITTTHQGNMANNDSPKDIWYIFNAMHDAASAATSHTTDGLYFIGNVIYDVGGGFVPFSFYGGESHYYVGNTISTTGTAIHFQDNANANSPFSILIANNIFNSGSPSLWLEDKPEYATLNNNLFYPQTGQAIIRWHRTSYNLEEIQTLLGQCLDCIEADPLFVGTANGDFHLQSTSPAVDAGTSSGVVQEVFDRFQTLYGIDIRKDIEGVSRPQGVAWDIGAYERVQGPSLLVSSTAGGSVTNPGEDYFQYDDTTDVAIEAAADQYYYFVNWTGTAVDAGRVANPTAAGTTVTVDSGYTLVANFDTDMLTLTVSSTSGGAVGAPGEGSFLYDNGTGVSLQATADLNYHFVNWTGTAVSTGKVADAASASTTVTMDGDYTLVANFAVDQHNLTTSLSSGGTVTAPGVGTYAYDHGALASVAAAASANYHFVNWTGTAVDAGKVANANSASTTVTMDAAYSIRANFALDQHTLTVSSSTGGSVTSPGEGSFLYDSGTGVSIQASASSNYYFINWTGTAVSAGKVANPNSASTTVTVDAGYTIRANFGQQDGVAPTVSNLSPTSGSIQAPLNSLIVLHVTDAGIGVDADTVRITLDGSVIYTGDVSVYNSTTGTCRRTGAPNDYTYAYQSDEPFDFDQLKTVTVNAADIGGVAMANPYSYSFRTEMRSFGQNKQVSSGLDALGNDKPATVRDGSGNIWAAWHAGPVGGRDIYVGKLTAGADAFGASVRVTSSSGDEANPAIAVGSDNRLYVVWQDNRRGNWDIYGSTSTDGTSWVTERRIVDSSDNESFNQVNPALAVDGRSPSHAYVVWQDDRAGNYDVYIAESIDAFATNVITQVTSNTSNQTSPVAAVGSSNTVYVLWTDARNPANGTDIYGASGSPWTNVPVVSKAANQSDPAIAVESSGSVVHILWVDQASGNNDIYYASSTGLPASSLAGSSLIDDTEGKEQVSPAVAVAGTGGSLKVFACWQDHRNVSGGTGDTDIYMVQTNSGSGTNVFVGDGGTNSNQTVPVMGVDSSGYPYIVWADSRGTNAGIYYAGSTCTQSTALVSGLIDASSGGTVGTADAQSINDVDDASIAIPAGASPYDVTVSITKVDNPQEFSLPILNGYEFSPSGLELNSPVTITIPFAVSSTAGTPTPYWYNSLTGTLSQQGIDNIEIIEPSSSLHALRFTTTHLTPYYALLGAVSASTDSSVSVSGSSGGGGGGCSLSSSRHGGSAIEYFLPYCALALIMLGLRLRDRRRERV